MYHFYGYQLNVQHPNISSLHYLCPFVMSLVESGPSSITVCMYILSGQPKPPLLYMCYILFPLCLLSCNGGGKNHILTHGKKYIKYSL